MSSFFSWDLVWEFFPKILSALPVTLMIVGIATLVGLVLGSFIAFIRVEKIPILNQIAAVFVSFIRGTPILVQLYIVYYGVPSLLQPRFPKNYNVVGGTTPKVLYNCDCFFVISPTRTALPGFSNASMTSNSSSNSCIV